MARNGPKAWASRDAAARHLAQRWGADVLASAIEAARGSNALTIFGTMMQPTIGAFDAHHELGDLVGRIEPLIIAGRKQIARMSYDRAFDDIGAAFGEMERAHTKLARAIAEAGRRVARLRARLLPKVTLPTWESRRLQLVKTVRQAVPTVAATAADWAYFEIALGLDVPTASASEFGAKRRPRWAVVLRRFDRRTRNSAR